MWATRDSASPETSEDVRGRLALYKEWRSVVFFVSKRRCRKKRNACDESFWRDQSLHDSFGLS